MCCTRCQGLMVEDHLIDMEASDGLMWITAWRCVNCGHAVDPCMTANRRLRKTAVASSAVDKDLIHDPGQEEQCITPLAA
jgi:hypothetical protein